MMRKQLLLLSVMCFTGLIAIAQTNGDYRSRQTGNWNTVTTWEVFNGGWNNLEDPGAGPFQNVTPTSASGIITLQGGIVVTVPAAFSLTIDQTLVDAFGELHVSGTLTIANGTGNDLEFYNDGIDYGYLNVNSGGIVILNDLATLVGTDQGNGTFLGGSTYRHFYTTTEGSIPVANWASTSLVEIRGYTLASGNITASAGGNWGQTFGNFYFDSPIGNSTRIFDFAGLLINVAGELRIVSTGIGRINLSTTQGPTIGVGTDLSIRGTSRVVFSTTGNATVNVGQDFIFNSTLAAGSITNSTGTTTINIGRDFSMNAPGGQLILSSGAGVGNGTLNITRDFILTAGTLTETSSGTGVGNVNFVTSTTSAFTNSGTITNSVNFSVASLKTLNLGTSAITGGGTLTLNGTIGLGSTDAAGALQTGTTGGNIRVSGTRTYASNSTIVYNGTAAQFIGNGFPSGGDVNLSINNTAASPNNTVTLSTNLDIVALRVLTLTNGNIVIGTQTLTINGTVAGSGGIVGGATSNLVIGGTGNFGTLTFSGSNQLFNFTINRTSSGLVTLGGDLTILGTFTQTAGNLNLNGFTFQLSGAYSLTAGNITSASAASRLIIDGAGSLPGTGVGFGTGSTLNSITLDRASAIFNTGSSVTITNLNLLDGTFNNTGTISIAGTITREAGTLNNAVVPSATTYSVRYTNGTNINSGPELPVVTTQLEDLTKDGSGTLTLSQAITVNGTLRFNDGVFDASTQAMDLRGNLVTIGGSSMASSPITFSGTTVLSGTPGTPIFGNITITGTLTPNTTYRINGNVTNNGTLNPGAGTVTFGGTTTISGSSATSWNNIQITGTLNAPTGNMNIVGNWINNGTFNGGLSTNTVTFTGTTSVSGSSSTNFSGITISGTLDGPSSLNLAGNFTNNGTFNRNSGIVVFSGTSTQSIQGSTLTEFNDISVTNTAGPPSVRVQSNQDLRGTLTLASNSIFDADGSGNTAIFRLRSTGDDQTVDASIATIPTGAQVTGSVTVQRFMSIEPGPNGNNRLYRNISSPVQGAAVSQIKTFIPISGTFTGQNHSGLQSMFQYNEPVITDTDGSGIADLNDGYVDFPDVADTETLAVGRGYNIFVRGNETPITTAGSALFEIRGPVNTGPIGTPVIFPVSFTTSGNVANDGWNLVGNPFPATIDWNAASGWTRGAGITATIYMRDNGNNPAIFATWNGVTGTNGGSRNIAMGQAFWVKSDGSGATTLTADERVKVGGTQTSFFREDQPDNILRITLKHGDDRDESVIHFREDATDHFDSFADAVKLDNTTTLNNVKHFNLATFDADNLKMAINSISSIACGKTIKIDVRDVAVGGYSLDFSEFESFAENVIIELHDNTLDQVIDVRENPSYAFAVTDQVNTYGSERFYLTFSFTEPEEITFNAPGSICTDENLLVTIEDSNPEVYYSIVKAGQIIVDPVAGNGNSLIIEVPKNQLQVGSNDLSVKYFLQACDQLTYQKPVSFEVQPKPQLTATDAQRCQAGELTLQASGGVEGNYRWYETESGNNAISGADASTFTTPSIVKTSTYYVAAVNALGCEGPRVAIKAEVVNYDPAAISVEGEILSSNFETGNQWYFNGDPISGATGQSYHATENGLYMLEIQIGECTTSAELDMIVTGIETSANGVHVFPNPTADEVVIRMETASAVKSQIFNAQGQKIYDERINTGNREHRISLQKQQAGIYFLFLFDGKKLYKNKIVKK